MRLYELCSREKADEIDDDDVHDVKLDGDCVNRLSFPCARSCKVCTHSSELAQMHYVIYILYIWYTYFYVSYVELFQ